MLLVIAVLTSCLKSNDDEAVYYNDAAITSFTLGTLNRYLHTTTAAGKDSIYKTSVAASSYKFNIDQINHVIFNPD